MDIRNLFKQKKKKIEKIKKFSNLEKIKNFKKFFVLENYQTLKCLKVKQWNFVQKDFLKKKHKNDLTTICIVIPIWVISLKTLKCLKEFPYEKYTCSP